MKKASLRRKRKQAVDKAPSSHYPLPGSENIIRAEAASFAHLDLLQSHLLRLDDDQIVARAKQLCLELDRMAKTTAIPAVSNNNPLFFALFVPAYFDVYQARAQEYQSNEVGFQHDATKLIEMGEQAKRRELLQMYLKRYNEQYPPVAAS